MNIRNLLAAGLLSLVSCTSDNNYTKHDNVSSQNTGSAYNYNQENQNKVEKYKDIISMERIEELMKRGSVDEILKEGYENKTIEHLVYNPKAPEESARKYKEFVFQRHLDSKDRKPVLVMFYHHAKLEENRVYEKREAIIFKEIERLYGDKINSLAFRVDPISPPKAAPPYGEPLEELIGVYIRGPPSIAMYGKFDLLKGETPDKNDGKIKHLDTSFKGPLKDEGVAIKLGAMLDYWLPNISLGEIKEDGLYRRKNTSDWHKVEPASLSDSRNIYKNK